LKLFFCNIALFDHKFKFNYNKKNSNAVAKYQDKEI